MPNNDETERQYRLSKQIIDIHGAIRDAYKAKALFSEIVLLGCSIVFCATTFADEDLFLFFGVSQREARVILGITSVCAFFASLIVLLCDWKALAGRHHDAFKQWADVISQFREARLDDGTWPDDSREKLNAMYWAVNKHSIDIPDKKYNKYKAKYLTKMELGKLIGEFPGIPIFILRITLIVSSVKKYCGRTHGKRD